MIRTNRDDYTVGTRVVIVGEKCIARGQAGTVARIGGGRLVKIYYIDLDGSFEDQPYERRELGRLEEPC